jgi:hypothetical protein
LPCTTVTHIAALSRTGATPKKCVIPVRVGYE